MRILKDNTLALVIDVQEKLFPHMHERQALEKNLGILVDGLKALDVPVLLTEQYKKGLGETLPWLATKMAGYPCIEKTAFSCCDEPAIMEQIATSTKREVIMAGTESHVCVLQTALDLYEMGYRPIVVEDCVGSRKPNDKRVAMKRLEQEDIRITTYEAVLFELCRFSGSEVFKAISRLVK